jgi:hypothetical protein
MSTIPQRLAEGAKSGDEGSVRALAAEIFGLEQKLTSAPERSGAALSKRLLRAAYLAMTQETVGNAQALDRAVRAHLRSVKAVMQTLPGSVGGKPHGAYPGLWIGVPFGWEPFPTVSDVGDLLLEYAKTLPELPERVHEVTRLACHLLAGRFGQRDAREISGALLKRRDEGDGRLRLHEARGTVRAVLASLGANRVAVSDLFRTKRGSR